MTNALETESVQVAEPTYEVVFCAPGEALGAKSPQWFIEGCYARFEDAQRAATALSEATHTQLHAVTILHSRFDPARGAFRERVVWSLDRSIALLSRLNLKPLESAVRESIVAHCDAQARSADAQRQTLALTLREDDPPSPVMLGLASMLAAAACAIGVLVVLT